MNNILNVLFGDSEMTAGLTMPRVLQTALRVATVAVAVKAITLILSGIKLLTSPRFANSLRKVSPLKKTKKSINHCTYHYQVTNVHTEHSNLCNTANTIGITASTLDAI